MAFQVYVSMMGQSIADIFSFTSILLTGFTGLVGKCLVWKLLTSCPDLKNIYVLVRGNKKIPDPKRRFEDLLNSFPLSELDQSVKNKIVLLEGDLSVNFENFNGLIAQIDIVVHAASSVNFEESINTSIEANVVGCKNLLDFCLTTLKPKLFVYISTAYAHCDQGDYLTEKISTVEQSPDDVINAFRLVQLEQSQIKILLKNSWSFKYPYSIDMFVQQRFLFALIVARILFINCAASLKCAIHFLVNVEWKMAM